MRKARVMRLVIDKVAFKMVKYDILEILDANAICKLGL